MKKRNYFTKNVELYNKKRNYTKKQELNIETKKKSVIY